MRMCVCNPHSLSVREVVSVCKEVCVSGFAVSRASLSPLPVVKMRHYLLYWFITHLVILLLDLITRPGYYILSFLQNLR